MVLLAGQNPATLAGKLAPEILANLHRRNADYSLKRWLPKITRSFTIRPLLGAFYKTLVNKGPFVLLDFT